MGKSPLICLKAKGVIAKEQHKPRSNVSSPRKGSLLAELAMNLLDNVDEAERSTKSALLPQAPPPRQEVPTCAFLAQQTAIAAKAREAMEVTPQADISAQFDISMVCRCLAKLVTVTAFSSKRQSSFWFVLSFGANAGACCHKP